MYELKEYLHPVWMGKQVFRETFTMISENGICSAPFLYHPEDIIKVESYDGRIQYQEGKDWYVEDDKLVIPSGSQIQTTGWEGIYFSNREEAEQERKKLPPDFGLPPIATNDGRYIKLFAIGHPWIIYDWQIAVTYTTKEAWEGYHPVPSIQQLPKLYQKLQQKKPVKLVLYGDSISYGFDCTGIYQLQPKQPIWAELIRDSMAARYDTEVTLMNASSSGQDSDWALKHIEELVIPEKPDLVILGFGMNDRCPGTEYRTKTALLRDKIQEMLPDTEFILMATSLPNTLLNTEPLNFCAYQDQYSEALKPLCGLGCVLADIQEIQRIIMQRKRYIDLAGNNINHPNDYFARVHAQIIDTLLMP